MKAISSIVKPIAGALKPIARKVSYHSPAILTVSGIGLIVGGTAILCKATSNVGHILNEWDEEVEKYDDLMTEEMEHEERIECVKEHKAKARKMVAGVVSSYVPGVMVETAGIACMLGANHILNKRVIAYAAAAAASETKLRQYRNMVKKELGEGKDDHFLVQDEEVEVEETKILKNGKEKKTVKKARVIHPEGLSQYSVIFDENNSKEWLGSYKYDQAYIMEVETWANAMLQHDGVLYLSDVIKRLGIIDPEKNGRRYQPDEGRVCGWLKDGVGDGYVWIRMVEFDENFEPIPSGSSRANELYRGFWLDFNVDGVIFGKA